MQLAQNEKETQEQAIEIESQAIKYNIKHKVQQNINETYLALRYWHSIDEINQYWAIKTEKLQKINSIIEKIKFIPMKELPDLTLPEQAQISFNIKFEKEQQYHHREHLKEALKSPDKEKLHLSNAYYSQNGAVLFNLHLPIIIENELIAYIEVSYDLKKMFMDEMNNFLISQSFSLSENGITLFSSLPEKIHINNVTNQFKIGIYGRQWQVIVWSEAASSNKNLFLILSLVISFLAALSIKLFTLTLTMSKKQNETDNHLKQIDSEFRNSKAKLIQSNKLTSLGEIATGIAHEINQPLQVICIHTDMCEENIVQENYHLIDKSFKAIATQVDRIEKIVKQVGSFGRDSNNDNFKEEKTIDIFESVLAIVINQYKQDKVELRQVIPPSLPTIYCNKIQIEQVLVNLLINAKDSVETSVRKIVFIKAHIKNDNLYIQISDTGTGIDPTKINEIFTPFYTTKPLGKGTGLGLSISYSMIHQHKGEISVTSEIGKGSVFTVKLPLSQ